MRILYVYADQEDEWNTSQWRCFAPAYAINKYTDTSGSPYGAQMMHFDDLMQGMEEAQERVAWADMVVIERLLIGSAIPRIIELESGGKVVVADLDDSYEHMPTTVRTYKFWHEGVLKARDQKGNVREYKMNVPPFEQLRWGLKVCNAVTSPSSVILKDWSKYVDNVYLAPNYIPTHIYLPAKRQKTKTADEIAQKFVIGWGGSWTHVESWKQSGIIEALKKVCEKYPQVVIRVAGGDPRIAEAINIPGRVFSHQFVEFEDWPKLLSEWDLGLVPLFGNYDNRRSWIKSLEYTLMGIPWVGSKAPPTDEFSAYGTQVKNSSPDWKKAICSAIDNYSAAKAKVDSGFEFAMAQDVDANVGNVLSMYQAIYDKAKGE